MPEKAGRPCLILSETLGLSEASGISQGSTVVLYGVQDARGPSTAVEDGDALLLNDSVAQAGPGSIAEVVIRDSIGEESGTITLTQRSQTIEDYCGYGSEGASAVSGPISDELLSLGTTSFLLYENTNTGDRHFGFFHDEYNPGGGGGGNVDWSVSGIPSGASTSVEDDPDHSADSYDLSGGTITHGWTDPNTDGVMIGPFTASELDGVTVTFSCTTHTSRNGNGPPSDIQFIGDEGTTVSRAYDGTNTEVEITFG